MAKESDIELRKNEYALSVPNVPRQLVDVFACDLEKGQYGYAAEVVDTLYEYARLQQTLASFDTLTLSPEIIARLPNDVTQKLQNNIYPGIPLGALEIPTTDKVMLAELLVADALTDVLSQEPVEVWITDAYQQKLESLGVSVGTGLQQIEYAKLTLEQKRFLNRLMEYQELQVHTILTARERFPEGVPSQIGILAQMNPEAAKKIVRFETLEDLEEQFQAAANAIDNPMDLLFTQIVNTPQYETIFTMSEQEPELSDAEREEHKTRMLAERRRAYLAELAKTNWWEQDEYYPEAFADIKEIAATLRAQYEGKTLYQIFHAHTADQKREIYYAFQRMKGVKSIHLDDGRGVLTLKSDGNLYVHFSTNGRKKTKVTGELKNYYTVAMVDQAVKWISKERGSMKRIRHAWDTAQLSHVQSVESTLVLALQGSLDQTTQAHIEILPQWFLDALNQELTYYRRLPMFAFPESGTDPLFSLSMEPDIQTKNLLKDYFIYSRYNLNQAAHLLANPAEQYAVLGLDSLATDEQIKDAYRAISKETKAIHVGSADQFDREEWERLNTRFAQATKAYKALLHRKPTSKSLSTLGRLTSYFEQV